MQLRLQLQTTRKNSMSMMDYIMKLKSFSDSLAAIGEPVSEQDQIMNLLGGLGADYNAVVTSISARDDKISIDTVHSMLLSFENRLDQQNSHDEGSTIVANIAQNKSTGGRAYYKNNQGYQRSLGQSSNQANNQNYFGRSRGRGGRGGQAGRNNGINNRPQCQLCGKFGHTVHSCYHRFDITFQAQTSTNQTQNQGQISAMVATPHSVGDDSWFLDSGATHHLTQSSANLINSTPYSGLDQVTVGNGKQLSISAVGSQILDSNSVSFSLKKVFYVPYLSNNLISVAQFCADNNSVIEFHPNCFFVKDRTTKRVLAQGKLENGLYKFPVTSTANKQSDCSSIFNNTSVSAFHSHVDTIELWHSRVGHASSEIVHRILKDCNVSVRNNTDHLCSSCQYAKSHRLPYQVSTSRAASPLDLVYTDIWGPAPLLSTSGARYFILFVDDNTSPILNSEDRSTTPRTEVSDSRLQLKPVMTIQPDERPRSSKAQIADLIAKLNSTFALRDLGLLTYFLGIEVSYDSNSMHLCQTKYISDLLDRTDMKDCKPAKTPGVVFRKSGVENFDPMNEQFDPHRHYAVFEIPDGSKPPETVAAIRKADNSAILAEIGVTAALDNNDGPRFRSLTERLLGVLRDSLHLSEKFVSFCEGRKNYCPELDRL
ncbi:hypothetical protein HHK36_015364 [Tetracentron sinense]|uniref:Polyprotein n=1 Tax=Tetracentron sinense TaxID=13715 RepID=A0A835DCR2_TETSI|nr:hypothetical protein HHK36_015364 [Tetracentron sinense]